MSSSLLRWARRALALAGLGVIAALLATAVASAATVINERVPISGTYFNSCTNENVDFSGVLHVTFRVTDNGDSVHIAMHGNAAAKGVGQTSGDTYTLNDASNEHVNIAKGSNGTFVLSSRVVSHGSAPNEKLHCHLHVTVNANGDVTAQFSRFELSCT